MKKNINKELTLKISIQHTHYPQKSKPSKQNILMLDRGGNTLEVPNILSNVDALNLHVLGENSILKVFLVIGCS